MTSDGQCMGCCGECCRDVPVIRDESVSFQQVDCPECDGTGKSRSGSREFYHGQ